MREEEALRTLCSKAQRGLSCFQYMGRSSSSLCKSILSGNGKGKLNSAWFNGRQGSGSGAVLAPGWEPCLGVIPAHGKSLLNAPRCQIPPFQPGHPSPSLWIALKGHKVFLSRACFFPPAPGGGPDLVREFPWRAETSNGIREPTGPLCPCAQVCQTPRRQ